MGGVPSATRRRPTTKLAFGGRVRRNEEITFAPDTDPQGEYKAGGAQPGACQDTTPA